jgi:hypothetical protein
MNTRVLCFFFFCHGPRKRATQMIALHWFTQRADARWLGGPVKPGHDNEVRPASA